MDASSHLPINSFSLLLIHNFVRKGRQDVPLLFRRAECSIPKFSKESPMEALPNGFPPRPPSILPSPKGLCINLRLGDKVGNGRVGRIHGVDILDSTGPLPPLVAKFALHGHLYSLEREAWFYEEMESLQNVSIARCYGFFIAELDDNHDLIESLEREKLDGYGKHGKYLPTPTSVQHSDNHGPLDGLSRSTDPQSLDIPNIHDMALLRNRPGYNPAGVSAKISVDSTEDSTCYQNNSWITNGDDDMGDGGDQEPDPDVVRSRKEDGWWGDDAYEDDDYISEDNSPPDNVSGDEDPKRIGVLILERLGDYIPLKTNMERIKSDVFEVYNDLARLGIIHGDPRWRNILRVPNTSQRTICPNHGRIHHWYPIDFDLAEKSDGRPEILDSGTDQEVGRLLDGLSYGTVVEPWD